VVPYSGFQVNGPRFSESGLAEGARAGRFGGKGSTRSPEEIVARNALKSLRPPPPATIFDG
jgi:hypothetical protein